MTQTSRNPGAQSPLAAFVLAVAALIGLLSVLSVVEDHAGRLVLGQARPVFDALANLTTRYALPFADFWLISFTLAITVLGLTVSLRLQDARRQSSVPFVAVVISSSLAALLLHFRWHTPGLAILSYSFIFALLLGSAAGDESDRFADASGLQRSGSFAPIFLVVCTVAVYRFYGINQIVPDNGWDWETPAANIRGTWMHGVITHGLRSPGISQGFLCSLLNFVAGSLVGFKLITLRVVLAATSTALVLVHYLLSMRLLGRRAALISAVLLAVSPPEMGWGRYHYSFTLPVVALELLILSALLARERRSAGRLCFMVAMMTVSNWLYPGAMLGVFVPIALFGFESIKARRLDGPGVLAVGIGAVLWLFSPTIIAWLDSGRLTFLSPQAVHGSGGMRSFLSAPAPATAALEALRGAFSNLGKFVHALFVDGKLGNYGYLTKFSHGSALSLLGIVFIVPGFLVLKGRDRVFWCVAGTWAVIAMLPGLLSVNFATRRFCCVLPVFYIVSAAGIDRAFVLAREGLPWLRHRAVAASLGLCVCSVLFALNGGLFFGAHRPERHYAERLAEFLAGRLQPRTLYLLGTPDVSKVLYLLLSELSASVRTGTFVSECNGHYSFGLPVIERPGTVQDHWFYSESRLARAPRAPVAGFDNVVAYVADIREYQDVVHLLHGRPGIREERHQICEGKAACSIVAYEGVPSAWPKSRQLSEVSTPVPKAADATCKNCVALGQGGIVVWTRQRWPRPMRGVMLQVKGSGALAVTVRRTAEESVSQLVHARGDAPERLQFYEVPIPQAFQETWAIEVRPAAESGESAFVLGSVVPLFSTG